MLQLLGILCSFCHKEFTITITILVIYGMDQLCSLEKISSDFVLIHRDTMMHQNCWEFYNHFQI